MGRISVVGLTGTFVHLKPGSTLQFDEQPSPSTVLPSSQFCPFGLSTGSSRPSPQTVAHAPPAGGADGLEAAERRAAVARDRVAVVALLGAFDLALLPHTVVVQVVGPLQPACAAAAGVVQIQPSAFATGLLSSVQVALQPSPRSLLPSSHCSLPATLPSPHLAARQPRRAGTAQPHSTRAVGAQPSPLDVLPSSHSSLPSIM